MHRRPEWQTIPILALADQRKCKSRRPGAQFELPAKVRPRRDARIGGAACLDAGLGGERAGVRGREAMSGQFAENTARRRVVFPAWKCASRKCSRSADDPCATPEGDRRANQPARSGDRCRDRYAAAPPVAAPDRGSDADEHGRPASARSAVSLLVDEIGDVLDVEPATTSGRRRTLQSRGAGTHPRRLQARRPSAPGSRRGRAVDLDGKVV